MSQTPSGFCVVPWLQLTAQTNGDLRACCQMIRPPYGLLKSQEHTILSAINSDPETARNVEALKKLRVSMLKGGRPESCRLCYEEEALGLASKREIYNHHYSGIVPEILETTAEDGSTSIKIKSVDFRLGNNCNLKCRYCSPIDSNSWADEYVKLNASEKGVPENQVTLNYNDYKTYDFVKEAQGKWRIDSPDFAWHKESKFLDYVVNNCHQFDRFYFAGGEPLLIKAHWELLKACVDNEVSKRISLEYNTNTSLMKDEFIELWSNFKHVSLGCSIDGMQEMAEYLRPPVRWNVIDRNLEMVLSKRKNILVNITITISIYNLYNVFPLMVELYSKGVDNISVHFVTYPEWCSAQILPPKAKEKLFHDYERFKRKASVLVKKEQYRQLRGVLEQIISHVKAEDRSEMIRHFYRFTEKLDGHRDQSFYQVAPQIHDLLQLT